VAVSEINLSGVTLDTALHEIRRLEVELNAALDRITHAQHRAEVAEQSAREAWAFARTMMTVPCRR
jgi:hypothetical protein